MKITQPLAILDTETTGTSLTKDKIVSIAIKKIFPAGASEKKYMLIDPECHIPAEATAVHGISNEMIKADREGKGAPKFHQVAKSIAAYLKDCILVSFNGDRFDLVLMSEEFNRCGISFPEEGFKSIDVMTIYHEKEKRDLTTGVKFYTGEEFVDAHNAMADVEATEKVLMGQLSMYEDLKDMDTDQLAEFSRKKDRVDLAGRLKRTEDNIIIFGFGKYYENKKPVQTVFKEDHSYYNWLMSEKYDAPADTKRWFKKIFDHVNKVKP